MTTTGSDSGGTHPPAAPDATDPRDGPARPLAGDERFRTMADGAPVIIWVTHPDGGLRYANRAYRAFFGVTGAQVEHDGWRPLVHPEDSVRYAGAFERALRARATFTCETRVRRADGAWRWIASHAEAYASEDGRFLGYIGISPDITDRKVMELELRDSRAELEALAARLDSALEEQRARIAGDLHDEMGQLLTALKMDVRWIERKLEDLPAGPVASTLLERAVDATTLVDRSIASVQQIAAELRPGVLDRFGLEAALRQEAREFERRTGVRCAVEARDVLPALSAEVAIALYRITMEALTNVSRHAEAAAVTIALDVSDGHALLRVSDDGRGPARADGGLGMASMRQRAERLGGSLRLVPGPVTGAVLTARLPLEEMAPVTASPFEQSLYVALESIPNPVFAHQPDGTLEYVNRHLRDFTGRTLESLGGLGFLEVFHPEDLAEAQAAWAEAATQGRTTTRVFRLRRRDGAYRRNACSISPVRDHRGVLVRWIGTWTDLEDVLAALQRRPG